MVSIDTIQARPSRSKSPIIEQISSPRISFSSEFLDDPATKELISTCPNSPLREINIKKAYHDNNNNHFEFLSSHSNGQEAQSMITADELFFEGKLLPFWQAHAAEKLNKINLNINTTNTNNNKELHHHDHDHDHKKITSKESLDITKNNNNNNNSSSNKVMSSNNNNNNNATTTWFVDDDPSPRPPKCTVLWKELLRLKKQRAVSALSPSSSSSSSSSSANSMADAASADEVNTTTTTTTTTTRHSSSSIRDHHNHNHNHHRSGSNGGSQVKGVRKGLERTRSNTIRIRPMINVPICTQAKSIATTSSLPPLFPLKKGKLFDR